MCLAVVAWQCHPQYPVILASNRDEFYSRPSEGLHLRNSHNVYAGKDLKSGGYWCGFNTRGLWGVVTNVRETIPPATEALSRGNLLRDYLSEKKNGDMLRAELPLYPGVNLLLGGPGFLHYMSNRSEPRELSPGLYLLSNGTLDEPWFKVRRTRERAEQLLAIDNTELSAWLPMMLDETRAPVSEKLPQTGFPDEMERLLSSAFIRSEHYGTRVTTLARRDLTGAWQLQEITHTGNQPVVEIFFREQG